MKRISLLWAYLIITVTGFTQDADKWENIFKNPPMHYRMNRNTHDFPDNTADQQKILDQYLREGYGGFATNTKWSARYLKDESEIRSLYDFVRMGKRRGMEIWLYDESWYPSGMAHDMILQEHPEWESKGLFFRTRKVSSGETLHWEIRPGTLKLLQALPLDGETFRYHQSLPLESLVRESVLEWTAPEGTEWLLVEVTCHVLYKGFQAGTRRGPGIWHYPSLLREEVGRRFVELTHQKYAEVLNAPLGSLFISTFTDEPSSMAINLSNRTQCDYGVYPWETVVEKRFRERTGTELSDALLRIATDEGSEGIRYRVIYFEIIQDLMRDHFFRPIREFCHKQGFASGGHLLLEETMMAHVPLYGSILECFREMDIPGVDLLTIEPTRTRRFLYSSRLAASAAELNGTRQVMAEVCPVYEVRKFGQGQEGPLSFATATLNRLMLGGVTKFNNYLKLNSANPETRYRINTAVARTAWLNDRGVRAARIGVFYPIETMWGYYRPIPTLGPYGSSDRIKGGAPSAVELEALFNTVSDHLFDNQWEFSYLDSRAIEESVVTVDGMLMHGDLKWQAVILPGVTTLSEKAMERLLKFVKAGGNVIFLKCEPLNSLTEFPSGQIRRLLAEMKNTKGFYSVEDCGEKLEQLLNRLVKRTIRIHPQEQILCAERETNLESIFTILNDSNIVRTIQISFPDAIEIHLLDPWEGTIRKGQQEMELSLNPYELKLFRVKRK